MFLVANRFELERTVRDVEVPAKTFAESIQYFTGAALADAGLIDDDMRRQDRYAAGNRPGVQVVHINHPRDPFDVLAHLGKVHTARCGF